MDSSDDMNEDDSGGLACGDVKDSDDHDCEVQAEDDDNHSNNRKEIEEQEHEVLSKSEQKLSFSPASVSVASDPEETPQRKFGYRKCSSLMVSACRLSMLSGLVLNPDITALCNGLNCSAALSAHVYTDSRTFQFDYPLIMPFCFHLITQN